MKILSKIALTTVAVVTLISCDNDFTVNDDWEDVTVVYGLLDAAADTNWLRIERGYLGSAPAEASFDEPDSLYYNTINATLEEFDTEGNILRTITLKRDDSKTLNQGIFTTEDYRMYYTTTRLNDEYTYELKVEKPELENSNIARAMVPLVETAKEENGIPQGFKMINPPQAQPTPVFGGPIIMEGSNNAVIYEVDVYFKYKEFDLASQTEEYKELKLEYETFMAEPDASRVKTDKVYMRNLYQAVANNLQPAEGKLRFFRSLRIEVWAGGEDLSTYVELNQPTGGLSESQPEFPQIENGTGLLSSRTQLVVDNVIFGPNDSRLYYLTEELCELNFAVAQGIDTFYCAFGDTGEPERQTLE